MVVCEAFVYKPVALLNASPRAVHAQAALRETLQVMSARIIQPASIALPLLGPGLNEDGICADPVMSGSLQNALQALHTAAVQFTDSEDGR